MACICSFASQKEHPSRMTGVFPLLAYSFKLEFIPSLSTFWDARSPVARRLTSLFTCKTWKSPLRVNLI